ncbi:hypothetical protein EJD04_25820 [Salmonella enterica]|nr:hypothetical protein [Salmonella enterica]
MAKYIDMNEKLCLFIKIKRHLHKLVSFYCVIKDNNSVHIYRMYYIAENFHQDKMTVIIFTFITKK